jgi:mono/diheme cytochrome c family protein
MKILVRIAGLAVVVIFVLQLARPPIPAKPTATEVHAPPAVRQILDRDCYSCHSDQRRLAWFDQIVPAYWLVRADILEARQQLDFSTLGAKPAAAQKATLYEAVNMMQLGAMPLPRFLALHPEARVTPQDLATLKAYLAPWSQPPAPAPSAPTPTPSPAQLQTLAQTPLTSVPLTAVPPEPTGFPFDPAFEGWKPLSITDRGDNNTFRFILGNDIAVRAARSGHISPWPDGARFAKIAWQQQSGPDGLIHPGKFVQVELMQKDAARYRSTEGWGWGRWRGVDLKPYGANAAFVGECTSCHQPMRGNDFVYTLPITAAHLDRAEIVNNPAAALPSSLPYQPLTWGAITLYVDRQAHTMALLYGNDAAMQAVRERRATAAAGSASPVAYPAGAVLALVTWAQRDDPHWFGARIPDVPQSVEFVTVAAPSGNHRDQSAANGYRRFAGSGLAEAPLPPAGAAERTRFITGLTPAWLP